MSVFLTAWNSGTIDTSSGASAPVAMDTGNPWEDHSSNNSARNADGTNKDDVPTSSTPPEGGWANFGDFGTDTKLDEDCEISKPTGNA